jgi:hypothetical protein
LLGNSRARLRPVFRIDELPENMVSDSIELKPHPGQKLHGYHAIASEPPKHTVRINL